MITKNMVSRLYFRLLPLQIFMLVITAVNGLVSGLFAGNFIGHDALAVVGLYSPINFLVTSVSTVFLGGSQIIAGKMLAKTDFRELDSICSLDVLASAAAALLIGLAMAAAGILNIAAPAAVTDTVIRSEFNTYIIVQAAGLVPLIAGQQMFAFLTLQQQNTRTVISIIASIFANVFFDYIFICVLHMRSIGLALASVIGSAVFAAILLQYFFTRDATLKIDPKLMEIGQLKDIFAIGTPGALNYLYQMVRGFIVNGMILHFVGHIGITAFSASNSLLSIFWAFPFATQVVSRILFSVYIAEEDRRSLTDTMKTVVYMCVPLTLLLSIFISFMAVPFTGFFIKDAASPAYQMTVDAFRILPYSMPFSVFVLSFIVYGQASGKQTVVHFDTLLDGVVCVVVFTAVLIGSMGMQGVYVANILNGVVTVAVFFVYSCIVRKAFPKNMEELMVVPDDFGCPAQDRIDISISDMYGVLDTAEKIETFLLEHGAGEREAYYGALCMEEMAGNIVSYGFAADDKDHLIDVRAAIKDDIMILRIKDDCKAFDPTIREELLPDNDRLKDIGIRMVFKIAEDVKYNHTLGLNVLTIRIRMADGR